jgi:hypothetical protein
MHVLVKIKEAILFKTASLFVTALGFKPKTFSSVVRCSIQLSYAASYFNRVRILT